MKQIELENWGKSPDDPRKPVYEGQRAAQEVFAELKHRLETVGMLPDEYFLMDSEWENGREIPRDADIFCTVQYGASEGIYLNVTIAWHDESKKHMRCFATGKTLGESESHLDRMYLAASAVNKALYSNEPHARYVQIGGEKKPAEGSVLHLNGDERQLVIDSLIEMRNSNPQDINAVEHLLRRVAGSITEYVNEVGARPLRINDFDRAILAIQDGNMAAFSDAYKNQPDRMGELLICAAARPGKVGLNMTSAILQEAAGISNEAYLAACKNAVISGSTEKALMLSAHADKCVADLDTDLHGKIIRMAISGYEEYGGYKIHMGRALVGQCTPEQIRAADPYTLIQAAYSKDTQLLFGLAEKKIDATHCASELINVLKYCGDEWKLKHLFGYGMEMNPRSFQAIEACIKVESVKMGKVLIDRGLSFEHFEQMRAKNPEPITANDTFAALKKYWEASNPPAKQKSLAEKMQAANAKAKGQDAKPGGSKNIKRDKRDERS